MEVGKREHPDGGRGKSTKWDSDGGVFSTTGSEAIAPSKYHVVSHERRSPTTDRGGVVVVVCVLGGVGGAKNDQLIEVEPGMRELTGRRRYVGRRCRVCSGSRDLNFRLKAQQLARNDR